MSMTKVPRLLRPIGLRLFFLFVTFLAADVLLAPVAVFAARNPITGVLAGFAVAGAALVLYVRLVGWLEQRPVTELDRTTMREGLLRGLWTGLALFSALMLLIVVSNGWRFGGYGSIGDMIATFGLMAGVATLEELLFRGVLFRIVEEWAGTVVALVVSATFFGGLHLLNPGATLWGALAIAVEAGLLLGAAYVLFRNLWVPIGLHLGWNFAESGIFGATTSGSSGTVGGLLTGTPHGPAIVSGGGFGPEASIYAVLVCLTAAYFLLRTARRRGLVHRASWR
ncbi:CPBP family intramembrane glutamic endopeptidase [Paractinoplanes brasiliensis]|nr:type II CAAX endopeptidase family protein [Actinoplanes brasiliensis]GID29234.1 CAAX amino protease [Actinoplanes brasiliensis]